MNNDMNTEWKWSKDVECYYISNFMNPPKVYCLGERFIYSQAGINTDCIIWRGSTIDHWGGWNFGYDLKAAIDWVRGATNIDLGHSMWTRAGAVIKTKPIKEFKLCYIDNETAYFTTQEISEQWGDDWNDVPYEYNAGLPYEPRILYYADGRREKVESDWNENGTPKWELYRLKFELDYCYVTPANQTGDTSIYSVEAINRKDTPWISGTSYDGKELNIWAGTSIEEFKSQVKSVGGKIFIEEP
jgi:hypothetical protein